MQKFSASAFFYSKFLGKLFEDSGNVNMLRTNPSAFSATGTAARTLFFGHFTDKHSGDPAVITEPVFVVEGKQMRNIQLFRTLFHAVAAAGTGSAEGR